MRKKGRSIQTHVRKQRNWKTTEELKNNFGRFNQSLTRFMILNNVWEKEVGTKSRYWKLTAVQHSSLIVEVKVSTAKQELKARAKALIKSLNKNFERAWIREIKIV